MLVSATDDYILLLSAFNVYRLDPTKETGKTSLIIPAKGPSINVNIFTSVQTIHFLGGRDVCENQHFFRTLLTFWPDFYYFHGDFWH